jgi:(E)-4-hydroxy-3-methylbut-2-enyl-diphosphate synthase
MPAKNVIFVGGVPIGAGYPVVIQSMTKTAPEDVQGTLDQIRVLQAAGCRLIRVALPAAEHINSFRAVVSASALPVIADIHFDHRLALAAIDAGAAAVRINPGNIGSRTKVREILELAAERGVALRIGVNSGSLEKSI